MTEKKYDLIIIGGGPGGYRAAERSGARGKKILLAEKELLGGVCLNWGCIPTKALLHSAKIFYQAQHAESMGISFASPNYDLSQAMDWKEKAVNVMRRGVEYLMKRYQVNIVSGEGRFIDKNTIEIGEEKYHGEYVIIATGSHPMNLPIPGNHLPHVTNSRGILNIKKLPKKLAIIGGGVIGIEFASYFAMLGVPVTVIEILPEILPNFDSDIGSHLRKSLPNCTFHLNSRVEEIDKNGLYVKKQDKKEFIEADQILIAVGRQPNIINLNLDKLNLEFNESGIETDNRMQTNIPNIFAIGDVTGRSMLAHSAYRMAEIAVNIICGKEDQMDYHAIPWIVYTYPEVSGVGITEKEMVKTDNHIKVKTIPLRLNGRFTAEHGNERGLCKVIIDDREKTLKGIQIVGGINSEIIYGAATMIQKKQKLHEIGKMIFPHPTLSEIIKDSLWEFME